MSGLLIGRFRKNSMVSYVTDRSPLPKDTATTPRVLLRLALMHGTISCGSSLFAELDWQPAVAIKVDYHIM